MYQTKIINNVSSITFAVLPPIEALRSDVENFRIVEYAGTEELAIKVCPNGLPGIVFQHSDGQSDIKSIVTNSGRVINSPPYIYTVR